MERGLISGAKTFLSIQALFQTGNLMEKEGSVLVMRSIKGDGKKECN